MQQKLIDNKTKIEIVGNKADIIHASAYLP